MIASQRQSRDDGDCGIFWHDRARRKRITHDAVVDFGIERVAIQADSGAAMAAAGDGFTKALVDCGLAFSRRILQRDQEAAFVRLVVAVILTGPGVYIHHSARRHRHVPRVTDAVGENGRAKTGRQLEAGVIVRARGATGCGQQRRTVLQGKRGNGCVKRDEYRHA